MRNKIHVGPRKNTTEQKNNKYNKETKRTNTNFSTKEMLRRNKNKSETDSFSLPF